MKAAPATDLSRISSAAFTLVEILLATALLLLLFSAVALNFSAAQSGSELHTGTDRFETLIRYARAQAAYTGRRVQIGFESDDASNPAIQTLFTIHLAWEPDPLEQSGLFVEWEQDVWNMEELNRLVGVLEVYLPGNSISPELEDDPFTSISLDNPDSEGSSLMIPNPIIFAPDGSCDSAHIHLAARVEDDPRTVTLYLSGLTGAFHHEVMEPEMEGEEESMDPEFEEAITL